MHADRVALHHGGLSIYIDDQAGQTVAFAVHEPVAIGLFAFRQSELAPVFERIAQAFQPEGLIDRLLPVGQDPQADAAFLIVADRQEASLVIEQFDQFAIGRPVVGRGHGAGKHPGMEALYGDLFLGLELELFHAG